MLLTISLVQRLYVYIAPQDANLFPGCTQRIASLQMLAAVFLDRVEVILPFWLQNRQLPYEP